MFVDLIHMQVKQNFRNPQENIINIWPHEARMENIHPKDSTTEYAHVFTNSAEI